MSSPMATKTQRRIKRFLFIGPTGVGKSTVINMIFNDNARPTSLLQPSGTSEGSAGATACFSTYYCLPDCALTDSIGFGDNRFNRQETISMLKAVVKNSMVGYNRIYLCVRYGRISDEIRYYIDLLTVIFGKKILKWCTLVFTYCSNEKMTKEKYLELNKTDSYMVSVINAVENVVFGDNAVHENTLVESVFYQNRQRFLDDLRRDMQSSNTDYYSPQPDNVLEWIRSILNVIMSKSVKEIKSGLQEIQDLSVTMSSLMVHQNFANYYGQCTICLDDMWDKGSAVTKCGHIFHRTCIDKWLEQKQKNCPMCRLSSDGSDPFVTSLYSEENKKKS